MHWLAALFVLLQLAMAAVPHPSAQPGVEITNLGATPEFGKQVTFRVRVQPLSQVRELLVYITPEGQSTVWQKLSLDQASPLGEIVQQVDVRQLTLFPFSKVNYRFEASLIDGQSISSQTLSFQYEDNRFPWQTLQSGLFEIHWYGDDSAQGQMIANIAAQGLQHGEELLAITPPTPLRIYAYASSADLQSALQLTNQPWVAGHATPELSLVLISVPSGPEKKLEMERQIPHEIMHILQYQLIGDGIQKQPTWLIEGMASLAELYPNPDYRTVLETAASSQSLIPFSTLCAPFPREASAAFQAYAQSDSFIRYIYNNYGATGLRKLIDAYQNGLGCEEGFNTALGMPLSQAEYHWQQEELGVHLEGLVLSNLSPYLVLSLLLILPAAAAFFPYRSRKKAHSAEDKR